MKVLIVRTFPDILNLDTYNVQEIGLAKALVCKGVECGVVFYNGYNRDKTEIFQFEREGNKYSFLVYWLKGFGFLKNGFMFSVYRIMKDYDVIQVHEYDQIFSWMLYTKMKKPVIIYHGPYYHEYAKGYNLKCKVFDILFLRWRKYDKVVALSKSELAREFLIDKGFRYVHTVGVGVDQDKFIITHDEKINCLLDKDDNRIRLLYVGKIEERRNVYFLIELFESIQESYNNLDLVIVGDGEKEYTENFQERIRKWIEVGRIKYFCKASQKELSIIYQNSDIFVFTSNYEIFGMVLLEALYFGLPVISSTNGGASVLIREGENGFMLEGFRVYEWKQKIMYMLEDKKRFLEMKRAAQSFIENYFLWDKLAVKFIEGYTEAMALFSEEHKGS